MISRRNVFALPVALPLAHTRLPRLDIADVRHEPLDVGATSVLSISPDGSMLAGIRFRNRLCFMDATTLETLALGEPTSELQHIDRTSIHWSPDQTRIAFSLRSGERTRDSDIYIADVATATITNVTAQGQADEAASLTEGGDALMDMYPRWRDDATLVFARHDSSDGETATCDLCTLNVESGAVETLVPLQPHGYRFVASPPIMRSNGSMIMTAENVTAAREIVIVDADSQVSYLAIERVQAPLLVGANGTHAVVQDTDSMESLLVPLDNPAATEPFGARFGYGDAYEFVGRPAIALNPETLAGTAISSTSGKYRVFTMIDGERRDRGYLDGDVSEPACQLAGNVLLVAEAQNAWLIHLDA